MEKIWFIHKLGVVDGPYSTQEVENGLVEGVWTDTSQIWWRGQREWMPISIWRHQLSQLTEGDLSSHTSKKNQWFVEYRGAHQGPLSDQEVVRILHEHGDIKNVRVWTEKLHQWVRVYQCRELLQELGIQKRVAARAPISGTFTVHSAQGPSQDRSFDLITLSERGFGALASEEIQEGEIIFGTIASPLLVSSCKISAKCLYQKQVSGFLFQNISDEARAVISSYVRQFEHSPRVIPRVPKISQGSWYALQEGLQLGPLSQGELLQLLTTSKEKGSLQVWQEGMETWTSAYHVESLSEAMGWSRRVLIRAPVSGFLSRMNGAKLLSVEVISASVGGLGLKNAYNLEIGCSLEWVFKSPNFPDGLRVRGRVTFIDPAGYASFQFDRIDDNSRDQLQTYVEKFHVSAA